METSEEEARSPQLLKALGWGEARRKRTWETTEDPVWRGVPGSNSSVATPENVMM